MMIATTTMAAWPTSTKRDQFLNFRRLAGSGSGEQVMFPFTLKPAAAKSRIGGQHAYHKPR